MDYSFDDSLWPAGMVSHYGHEQVGDAGCAHIAKRCELLTINSIEQQNASAEHLALIHRFECSGCSHLLRLHHHFQIPRLHLFHTAVEDDAAAIDEHDVGKNMLDLVHMMRCHYDGAIAVEIIVQQGIVELLAIQDVQTECRLVQHQQSRINCHHQSEMQLRHHTL